LHGYTLGDQVRDVAINGARRHFEFTGDIGSRHRAGGAPQYLDDLE